MDHVAIMKKSWRLIPRILSGGKTIETRWYKNKSAPWDRIKLGDTVYFKDSGGPVYAKAVVGKVEQFDNLTSQKINQIRNKYSEEIGLTERDLTDFEDFFEGKKYGILVWLKNAEKVPLFQINKAGFGAGAAWITVDSVDQIRVE